LIISSPLFVVSPILFLLSLVKIIIKLTEEIMSSKLFP